MAQRYTYTLTSDVATSEEVWGKGGGVHSREVAREGDQVRSREEGGAINTRMRLRIMAGTHWICLDSCISCSGPLDCCNAMCKSYIDTFFLNTVKSLKQEFVNCKEIVPLSEVVNIHVMTEATCSYMYLKDIWYYI